jgi:hypothetical protein
MLRVLVAARDTGEPIRHARLAVNQVVGSRWEQNYEWVTTLSPGLTLAGQVLDERGQPISGARVTHEPFGFRPTEAQTDNAGRFEFPPQPKPHTILAVGAEGFARQAIPDAGQAAGLRLHRRGEVEVTVEPSFPSRHPRSISQSDRNGDPCSLKSPAGSRIP